jgi:hypothetical protein
VELVLQIRHAASSFYKILHSPEIVIFTGLKSEGVMEDKTFVVCGKDLVVDVRFPSSLVRHILR